MCGIAGIFRFAPSAPEIDAAELARISSALAARGPDGEGSWTSPGGRIALAHRRLAVIDLSPAAAQPMVSRKGRHALVYNGEIYNFRALASDLVEHGPHLATESDSEVLLRLLARDGIAALSRLRGMYAFAFWHEETGELLLARDPYGIKPLYFSVAGGVLRFASQARALGAGARDDVDPGAVAGFLAWGAVPEPWTLDRAVRSLPAGWVLRASAERGVRLEPVPYVPDAAPKRTPAAALAASVGAHLVADVPVALFLSAGLDSALVAALAAAERRAAGAAPPTALTLTWAEARGTPADEAPLARAVAAALGLPHVVREVSAAEVRAALPEILAAMDQPSIDGFNTWLIARLAREAGFKVALSGLGGDELLGGYPSFADVPRWRRRAVLLDWVPGLAGIWPPLARSRFPERPKLAGLLRFGTSAAGAYYLRRGLFLPSEWEAMRVTAAGRPLDLADAYDPGLDAWEHLREGILGPTRGLLKDPWRAVHRMESTIYLRHQLLRDADWAGMAHGVEIRVPLVDALLRTELEAARFEPARSKGKRALARQVFDHLAAEGGPALPPDLVTTLCERPKTGFQLPIADWLDPAHTGLPRPVGAQSRRLAELVLSSFGVEVRDDDGG